MKRYIILFLILGLVSFGCVQQPATEYEYICSDGTVVSNPSLCPIEKVDMEIEVEITQETLLNDETLVIREGQVYYYGGDYTYGDRTVTRHFIVNSNEPVDVYVVPSKSDYNLMVTGKEFVHYPSCQGISILKYDKTCTVTLQGGIAISNMGDDDATVSLKVYHVG